MTHPDISVVLPVYNAEKFVRASIESILTQTFTNFELIVIDDCSTDTSAAIIQTYTDKRVRFYRNNGNRGIVETLNLGIHYARAKYIARMDADDISYPNRLALQFGYLEANPAVGVCGAYLKVMGKTNIIRYPVQHEDICFTFLRSNALAHPVVMFRKQVLTNARLQYEAGYFPAEDFYLWVNCAAVCRLHNLPYPLLEYNIHPGSVSQSKMALQLEKIAGIRAFHLLNTLHCYNAADCHILTGLFAFRFEKQVAYLQQVRDIFERVIGVNRQTGSFNRRKLHVLLGIYWYMCCKSVTGNKKAALATYLYARQLVQIKYLPKMLVLTCLKTK